MGGWVGGGGGEDGRGGTGAAAVQVGRKLGLGDCGKGEEVGGWVGLRWVWVGWVWWVGWAWGREREEEGKEEEEEEEADVRETPCAV